MSSELSSDARKVISRWAKDGYYVNMNPTTSKWYWPKKKHLVYWRVTVEFRNADWIIWTASGSKLNDVILCMNQQIPRRSKLDKGFVPADKKGTQIGRVSRALPHQKRRDKVYFEIRKSSVSEKDSGKNLKKKKHSDTR